MNIKILEQNDTGTLEYYIKQEIQSGYVLIGSVTAYVKPNFDTVYIATLFKE